MSCTNCTKETPCTECADNASTIFDATKLDSCICEITSRANEAYACSLGKGMITPEQYQEFLGNINIYSSVDYDPTTGTYVQGIVTSPTLIVALTLTNALCNGESTGTAAAAVSGGTAPYTLVWETSLDVAADPAALPAGSYKLTVTDANGVVKLHTFNITEPAALAATFVVTDETSGGAGDGTATITATGGTSPYTYLWSDAQTTNPAVGLVPGTYTAVITDDNGCTFNVIDVVIA